MPSKELRVDHFPWSVEKTKYLLSVMDAKRYPIGSASERPDQLANALLMAAAPELLTALEELYAMVKGECPSLLNEDSGGCARLDMAIEDAINKARGKA